MQAVQTSFLIKCDKNGQIMKIYWYQPVFLISPFQKHLSDLFDESQLNILDRLVGETLMNKNLQTHQDKLLLRTPQASIYVNVMAFEDELLVLGVDEDFLSSKQSYSIIPFIFSELLKTIITSDSDNSGKRESTIRMQFEQIQKLNNKMINTQRELSKVNAEINRLNSYLNNRLVKDELTGLVSRYQYREEIVMCIRNQPEKLGIFTFIDIDNFKKINDTYGHRAGDEFLKMFSTRLQQISFDGKICMRISGDEFGLYIHGYDTIDEVNILNIWREIESKVLFEPAIIEGASIPVRLSAGMAIYGLDTFEIFDLIEYADFAMYQAKKRGKNMYQRFDKCLYNQEKSI